MKYWLLLIYQLYAWSSFYIFNGMLEAQVNKKEACNLVGSNFWIKLSIAHGRQKWRLYSSKGFWTSKGSSLEHKEYKVWLVFPINVSKSFSWEASHSTNPKMFLFKRS